MSRCSLVIWGQFFKSHLLDLLLIGIMFGLYFLVNQIPPVERQFWRNDQTIMYPHLDHETIPAWALPLVSLGLPVVIMVTWLMIKGFSNKKPFVALIGLLLALVATVQLTTITKVLVGRLRPDFLARCNLDPSIVDRAVCRGSVKAIVEGRKSFPSGHTSSSFAGLGYTGFFMAGQLGIFGGNGDVVRFLVTLTPFSIAGFVGISRITDYRHHWQDVLAGAILGISMAYFCYRIYFPSIMRPYTEEPYDEKTKVLIDKEVGPSNSGNSTSIGAV